MDNVRLYNITLNDSQLSDILTTGRTSSALTQAYRLGIKHATEQTTAPTVSNDETEGFSVGSTWADSTNKKIYACTDPTTGSAVWFEKKASPVSGDTILFSTASVSWNNASIMGSSASEFSSDGAIRDVINLRQKALKKTTTTIATVDWIANEATKIVSGVTPSNLIFVAPAPASAVDYADAGIRATAQGDDSITFVCTEKPTSEIAVNIVIGD